ncbi:hypothetical protein G5I73_002530 [Escherichia coli]|nr:hypothetical protein [Escherichia coli]EFN9474879.1 hypothetical protein [Escherichia coli]EFN9653215.1 hypothetical protein [Escherichia coli]EKH2302677.1 hypothetical protein [Escherichia coli]ELH6406535.1 hypothetical protein [Escherichia coli]
MNNNTDVHDSRSTGAGVYFLLLLVMWLGVLLIPEAVFFVIPGLIGASLIFFIYYLASEGYLAEIIGGVVVSFIVMALATAIPVIGWIILVGWILYNIAKAFESIQNLLPDALLSAVLYVCLLIPVIIRVNAHGYNSNLVIALCGIVYFFAAAGCITRISKHACGPKHSLFLFSVMWLSVPMIVLLVTSVVASLRSSFRIKPVQTTVKLPQSVSGYTTVRGTVVAGYTRNVTRAVTSSVIVPGSGATGASLTGSLAELTPAPDVEAVRCLNHKKEQYHATDTRQHFYRYDALNNKKADNFIRRVASVGGLPSLRKEDILIYFDETLTGKGDRGVAITANAIYCLPGLFEKEDAFSVPLEQVENVMISGMLNKRITLCLKNGTTRYITLTQSGAGAEKLFRTIKMMISD